MSQYLGVISICFVVYGFVLFLNARARSEIPYLEGIMRVKDTLAESQSVRPIAGFPDIYYIILDGYTGPRAMLEHMRFSNDQFMEDLSQRGFYVAEDSWAIAPSTLKSISSSLNMTNDTGLLSTPMDILLQHIKTNVVQEFLTSQGYQTVNLSLFPLSGEEPFYRIYFHPRSSRIMKIYEKTLFLILAERIEESINHKHNMRIMEALKNAPFERDGKARFVYAHLMIPHWPFQFDRDGQVIPFWERRANTDVGAYIEQVLGTNKLILEAIDKILHNSSIAPVIIIQGDHGYRQGKVGKKTGLSILNAYLLPTTKQGELYPSIPPYNSFRLVLNAYFDTNLEILD